MKTQHNLVKVTVHDTNRCGDILGTTYIFINPDFIIKVFKTGKTESKYYIQYKAKEVIQIRTDKETYINITGDED